MRKIILILITSVLMLGAVAGITPHQAAATDAQIVDSTSQSVKLTEAQKKELAGLYKDILDARKEIIAKYVKYGVITEERGSNITTRLEERHKQLEQNGFVYPYMDKYCKRPRR